MAADLMGRRRSLMAAGVCGVLSALFMAFSTGFFGVCLSMAFSVLACSFVSGSDEALLYDSLLQAGGAEDFVPVSARYARVQNLGAVLSNAASALCAVLSFRVFYLVDALVCLVRTAAARGLTEPVVTRQQAQREKKPFQALGRRFREHTAQAAGFLREHPETAAVMLADSFMALPGYLTLMFLQQRLSEQGVANLWLGLPVMLISLARMAGVTVGEKLSPRRLSRLYAACALLVGAGTVCAGTAPHIFAVLGAMLAAGALEAWTPHLQKYLNARFPSDRRATLVSVNMMVYSLLMIGASPAVGWLGDLRASAGAGLCALGILVTVSGPAGVFLAKRGDQG